MFEPSISTTRLTSSQLATLFVEKSSDAVMTLDLASNIVTWNPGAEQLYGYQSSQILNQPASLLFPPGSSEDELLRRANLSSMEEVLNWETPQLSRGGSELSVCISVSPFFDKKGMLQARCMVARVNRLPGGFRTQVLQLQKLEAVGRLAGGIAHDFNNLLTVISGYNGLLRTCLPAESPLIGYTAEVEKAVERAATLSGELLLSSRRAVTAPEVLNELRCPDSGEDAEADSQGTHSERIRSVPNP